MSKNSKISNNYKLISFILIVWTQISLAQVSNIGIPNLPGEIPEIKPEDIEDAKDKAEKETIKIPIKNKDDVVELVEVIYDKTEGTQTITIPGHGDITLITDKDGNFDLTITPEDIPGSDNMKCNVSPLSKTTKCTVTPLYVIEDNKVYSADSATFQYKEGEETSTLDITSNELFITGKDEKTEIKKNETQLGNATISLNVKGENKDDFLLGTIPGLDAGNNDPENLESITISAQSSIVHHKVTNPNNPNEEKTKLYIPGGVDTSIGISQDKKGNLNLVATGNLNEGVKYDSDPFSDKKVNVNSNSSTRFHLTFTESGKNSNGTLVLSTDGTNNQGEKSQLEFIDTTKDGVENKVTTNGATSIIINQDFEGTGEDRKPGDTNFAIATESIELSNKEDKTTRQYTLTNATINGSGNIESKTGEVSAKADSLSLKDDSKKGFDFNLFGNVNAYAIANEQGEAATVSADNVIFSNKDINVNADGNILVSVSTTNNPTEKIGEQRIKSQIFAKADNISVQTDGTDGQLKGGTFYQASLEDGSVYQVANAQSGNVSNNDAKINFDNGARLISTYDKDGKLKESHISSAKLEATHKDKTTVSIQDSSTSILKSKDDKGVDITSILHSSSKVDAKTESQTVKVDGLNVQGTYSDDIKYGQVNFKKLEATDEELKGKVTVNNGTVLFYSDDSKKDSPFRQASINATDINYESKDIGLNITATGKDGSKKNFTIYYLEENGETIAKVFSEDGTPIKIEGTDKDKNFGDILFKSAQYYKTPEFTSFMLEEASGNIKSLDKDNELIGEFSAAKIAGYETTDGSLKQYSFEDGKLDLKDNTSGDTGSLTAASGAFQETRSEEGTTTNLQLDNTSFEGLSNNIKVFAGLDQINFSQTESPTQTQSSLSLTGGSELRVESNESKNPLAATMIGFDASGIQKDTIKYGNLNFKELKLEDSNIPAEVKTRVTLKDGGLIFYQNEDESNPFTQAQLSTTSIDADSSDYKVNITAIGEDGAPGKFTMFFLEEGEKTNVRVFDEDGKFVKISGKDKDDNFGDILFRSASYYQDEKFKQFMVDEVKATGTISNFGSGDDSSVFEFNAARLGGTELNDGTFRHIKADELFLSQRDFSNNSDASLSSSSASFTETNYLGTISQNIEAYDATINYTEYKDGKFKGDPKLSSKISFGSLVAANVENPDGKKISLLKVNDIDLLATDYENMAKVTGKIGEASYLDSDQVQIIDIKDLEKLKLESLDQDIDAVFNGKQFLKVDSKDANGNVTKSYLLIKDADGVINAKDEDLTAQVNLNARVFEFVRDEVTGQNVILKADADFTAKASFKSPVGNIPAKISGGIKGENITTSSSKFKSEDGRRSGGQFTIHADKLEKLNFKAEVGFIDLVELKAEGKNGQSINYSYEIDKSQGVIKLKGVYKNGDKLETKFLFFKLGSHKEGNDAVSALKIKLKGQSVQDHMAILSETASVRQINDFFGVSDGGAITFTAGAKNKGFAMELMMVNEKFAFRAPNSFKTFHKPTNSYGMAIKYITEDDRTFGVQAALTSDSRIEFEGDLEAFGTKVESIPTTANLNLSYTNSDKDLTVVGGVHVPLTSSLVDKDMLDPDAQFFDGGTRKANGPGAHLAVSKKFDNSELKFTAGMYDNFSEPSVHLTYQGSPQVLGRLGRGIINLASGDSLDTAFRKPAQGLSNYQRQKMRQKRIEDREIEEMEAKRMVILQDKVNKLKAYYKDKKGFNRIKEILEIADKYLNSPPDHRDIRKDIFSYTPKDRAIFSYYEDDQSKIEDIDAIVLGIIENKILVQLPLEKGPRETMLEIYRQRRYYELIKTTDQLDLINKSGLNPCEFYLQNHSEG